MRRMVLQKPCTFLLILILILSACGGGETSDPATETPEDTPTVVASEEEEATATPEDDDEDATATPEDDDEDATATPEDDDEDATATPEDDTDSAAADGLQTNDAGGFSFTPPGGWQVTTNEEVPGFGGLALLIPEDADPEDSDALIFITVGDLGLMFEDAEPDASLEELIETFMAESEGNIEASEPEPFEIDGTEAIVVDLSGDDPEMGDMQGRLALARLDDNRFLQILGAASTDTWNQDTFDDAVDSISLYEPVASQPEIPDSPEDNGSNIIPDEELSSDINSALRLPSNDQGEIEIGNEETAVLATVLEAHDWTFEGTAGQVVTIRCEADEGEDTDPRINLLNSTGDVLATDDDGGEGLNAIIESFRLPEDDTYTIKVDVFGEGGYVLSLEEVDAVASGEDGSASADSDTITLADIPVYPDEAEPANNDDPFVQGVTGELGEQDGATEVNVYTIPDTVTFDEIFDFYDDGLSDEGWTTSPNQGAIAPGDDIEQELAGWVRNEQVFVVSLASGPAIEETLDAENYLVLTLISTGDTSTADTPADAEDAAAEGESTGDTGADNPALDIPSTEEGTVSLNEEVTASVEDIFAAHDWLFEGSAGQIVTIRASSTGDTDTDPRVNLLDPDGEWLAADNDSGDGSTALLTDIELPADGVYTIKIDVFEQGSYSLIVEGEAEEAPAEEEPATEEEEPAEEAEPTPTEEAAAEQEEAAVDISSDNPGLGIENLTDQGTISLGDEVTGSFDDIFAAHDWSFEGEEGQTITIRGASAEGDNTAPRVNLLDPDGEWVAAAHDGGNGALIEAVELPADGTYTIRVDVFAEGGYVLSVEEEE